MKKIIILSLILLNNALYSQITLDHQLSVNNVYDAYFINTENGEVKYLYLDHNNWIVKIFNIDNTINTTIAINRNSLYNPNDYPNGGNLYDIYAVSQHLFDNDDEFEFLIEFTAYNSDYSSYIQKTAVIDANGNAIFSVDNQRPPIAAEDGKTFITNTSQGTKMMLTTIDHSTDDITDIYIYSLPGTLSSNIVTYTSSNSFRTYPNPTSNRVNIEYNLPSNSNKGTILVYNTLNQEVKRVDINPKKNKTQIDLGNLNEGIYLIRIVSGNYKSKIKRIIIDK